MRRVLVLLILACMAGPSVGALKAAPRDRELHDLKKRQKQQLQEMITQLKINDEVVTNGGIIGKIKEVKETSFIIQSAEKSFLEVGKSAVVGRKPE